MSIFSRRKRTRHLASLAISAVATSLCSSQVALCTFKVRVDFFRFEQNSMCFYILGCDAICPENDFETEMAFEGYTVYLTSDKAKFSQKVGERYCKFGLTTIDFHDVSLKKKLDELRQRFEGKLKIKPEEELKRIREEELEIEKERTRIREERQNRMLEEKLKREKELKEKQEVEQQFEQHKQNGRNVDRICNLIEEYERDSGYADEYSIEINANGDSGLKENLRDIISNDPIIQDDLECLRRYFAIDMINKKLRKITITREGDKYFIEVKLMK